jgi:hypothetical protein
MDNTNSLEKLMPEHVKAQKTRKRWTTVAPTQVKSLRPTTKQTEPENLS